MNRIILILILIVFFPISNSLAADTNTVIKIQRAAEDVNG